MASFQEQLQELNDRLEQWFESAKQYFSQLNDYEKYAWGAEAVGGALVIAGIVLFIV
ncbi:TPA: hypothetical protein HA251_07750 [Candidatus Woesearchaeota archaeon]|nr:hypothetical protein [Candidatus Woesearchaeota archaeon]